MSLQAKIIEDWKEAMRAKDKKKDTLSMIITELKNRAIRDNVTGSEGRVVADDIAVEVLQKMAKQRKESIEAYKAANRPELVAKEELDLIAIECYLPQPLNDDQLRALVQKAIQDIGAKSLKEMGQVMGIAIKAAQGRADGKRIQAMVQVLLQ